MIEDIKRDAESRMRKSIDNLREDLSKLRTGRAHTSLLDHIKVKYYGAEVPLNHVANVSVADARTLMVQPFDKNTVSQVEKAIMNSDLGLTPASAGEVIRVPLPPLTEERRRDLTKLVKQEAEGTRVAIRNIRRDANAECKRLRKDKEISEDDEHRAEEEIQKLTDKYVAEVDKILEHKEAELMEV